MTVKFQKPVGGFLGWQFRGEGRVNLTDNTDSRHQRCHQTAKQEKMNSYFRGW